MAAPTLSQAKLRYSTESAADALEVSETLLRSWRKRDGLRRDAGLEALGPRWHVDASSGGVFYWAADLVEWMERSGLAFGKSRFRGHAAEEVES